MRLRPGTRATLNDPELIAVHRAWIARLESTYRGERQDDPVRLNGVFASPEVDLLDAEAWMSAALDELAEKADALRDRDEFRPLCAHPRPFGVRIVDRVLGADVYPDRSLPLWHTRRLDTPIGELPVPDLERNDVWLATRRHAELFLAADVKLPLFGNPALSNVLNTAMNLYGEELFVAMAMEPQKVKRDFAVINEAICEMHRFYIDRIPADQLQAGAAGLRTKPPGYGHVDGCATQLISGEMYEEFVGPYDEDVLSLYAHGGMVHICGAHTQHIPAWRSMPSVRAVQVNDRAAEDLEAFLADLRDDQVLYLEPTQTMTASRGVSASQGRRLVIMRGAHDYGEE
jgi:hypothetical protein